jgi:hypothetical protein
MVLFSAANIRGARLSARTDAVVTQAAFFKNARRESVLEASCFIVDVLLVISTITRATSSLSVTNHATGEVGQFQCRIHRDWQTDLDFPTRGADHGHT